MNIPAALQAAAVACVAAGLYWADRGWYVAAMILAVVACALFLLGFRFDRL